MAELNSQQQAIVDFIVNGEGSANVIARAGTGKTYTLVNGVVKTIVDNNLGDAALMAFNKSASVEFEERIKKLGGPFSEIETGTVHSFGFRAWRRGRRVNVEGNKSWEYVRKYQDDEPVFKQYGSEIVKMVSLAKQSGIGVIGDLEDAFAWRNIIEHFDIDVNGSEDDAIDAAIMVLKESIEDAEKTVDFDDMIFMPLYANSSVEKFDFVLIDEAQDTNVTRRLLAFKMMKPNGRLIAVGDDRQAIYGFSGANSDSLDLIQRELNSKVFPLTVTYRCPKAVVAEANALVPDLTAHESAPDGLIRNLMTMNMDNGSSWYESEAVGANDAALCRNTQPLLETAYQMIADGKACRVEGRDIGEGLIKLATKWKRVRTLTDLQTQLEAFRVAEIDKWTARHALTKVQMIEDKVSTLNIIIDHLVEIGARTVEELVQHVRSMFGDTPEGQKPRVFTLSTVHKAKGREWERVYLLRRDLIPSKYARQEWQLQQEDNLLYVAITRAKQELIYVES